MVKPNVSVQFSSVTRLFPTLCDPMDYSILSICVHHQLQELAQTHVHQVGDAIQPSHTLMFLSPPAFNSNESALHIRWPKYWGFSFSISLSNEYSGLISFRIDWCDLLQSKGFSRVFSKHHSSKHQFKISPPVFCNIPLTSLSGSILVLTKHILYM